MPYLVAELPISAAQGRELLELARVICERFGLAPCCAEDAAPQVVFMVLRGAGWDANRAKRLLSRKALELAHTPKGVQ